jgi:hypothetical protein
MSPYKEIGNVRITYVTSDKRIGKNDWAGTDVLRIQAYRGVGESLHKGAELPIEDVNSWDELLQVIYDLKKYALKKKEQEQAIPAIED